MRPLLLAAVYPITDSRNPAGLDHVALVRQFLEAGIRFLQVREKELSDAELLGQLVEIGALCRRAGAQWLLNDRVELARTAAASGVHLGQRDLPVKTARRILGSDAIIGLSTHNRAQFEAAQSQDIDYLAVGPVFPTTSKENADPVLGVDRVREFVGESRYPVVAIGGITLESAPRLWKAGASVAVISDVAHAAEPGRRLAQYLRAAGGAPGEIEGTV